MGLVHALLSLLVPALLAYPAASLLLDEEGPVERFLFAFGLGLGVLSYLLFISGLFDIPFSVWSGMVPLFVFFLISLFVLLKDAGLSGKNSSEAAERYSGPKLFVSILIILYLFYRLGFVFYESASRPIFSWDAVSNWSQGAKFFFFRRGLALDPGDENFFGTGYRAFLGHPLHTVLLQVWTALWLGRFHEVYVKLWSFLYYTALLGIFYYAVRREAGGFYALVSLFFLSSAPLLAYHGTDAYSEVVVSYYALASVAAFLRFTTTGRSRLVTLSGVMLAFAALTKNEGLFFFVALLLALLIHISTQRERKFVVLLYLMVPFFVLYGPFLAFKIYHGLGFGHSHVTSGFRWLSDPKFGPGAPRDIHWVVLPVIVKEFFLSANHNLIFPFWLIVSILYAGVVLRTELRLLYIIILTVMASFVFVYLTLEVTAVTETTGIHRNTLTYLPLLFLAASLVTARAAVSDYKAFDTHEQRC